MDVFLGNNQNAPEDRTDWLCSFTTTLYEQRQMRVIVIISCESKRFFRGLLATASSGPPSRLMSFCPFVASCVSNKDKDVRQCSVGVVVICTLGGEASDTFRPRERNIHRIRHQISQPADPDRYRYHKLELARVSSVPRVHRPLQPSLSTRGPLNTNNHGPLSRT